MGPEDPINADDTARPPADAPYEALEVIATGADAVVYRARPTRNEPADGAGGSMAEQLAEQEVALKVWRRRARPTAGDFAAQCDLQRSLSEHPHVVRLLAASPPDALRPWTALELCDRSLADVLADDPPDGETARRWAADLLRGLAAVHALGWIHRDVKPGNVLIRNGRGALSDFGCAVSVDDAPDVDQAGTPGHLAPELLTGSAPSTRSDVYAAGLTLRSLLGGAPGATVANLLTRATSHGPTDRPADAGAFLAAFERATGPGDGATCPGVSPSRCDGDTARSVARGTLLVAALSLALLLVPPVRSSEADGGRPDAATPAARTTAPPSHRSAPTPTTAPASTAPAVPLSPAQEKRFHERAQIAERSWDALLEDLSNNAASAVFPVGQTWWAAYGEGGAVFVLRHTDAGWQLVGRGDLPDALLVTKGTGPYSVDLATVTGSRLPDVVVRGGPRGLRTSLLRAVDATPWRSVRIQGCQGDVCGTGPAPDNSEDMYVSDGLLVTERPACAAGCAPKTAPTRVFWRWDAAGDQLLEEDRFRQPTPTERAEITAAYARLFDASASLEQRLAVVEHGGRHRAAFADAPALTTRGVSVTVQDIQLLEGRGVTTYYLDIPGGWWNDDTPLLGTLVRGPAGRWLLREFHVTDADSFRIPTPASS